MSTTKLVTIESAGKISILGGIQGPITNPCRLSTDSIIELINSGKIVYEVNPKNSKEKIRLTRLNVYKTNFASTIKETVDKKKKVIEETIKTNSKPMVKPISEPNTTIIPETGEAMINHEELFQSNSHSTDSKKKRE